MTCHVEPFDERHPVQVQLSSDVSTHMQRPSHFEFNSKPAFFLDLFAGARAPVSTALHSFAGDCIEPINKSHGVQFDILDDQVYEALLRLAARCAANSLAQDIALQDSSEVHDRSRAILELVSLRGGVITLENPWRSVTWLDSLMKAWVQSIAPYLSLVAACHFQENWSTHWIFVSNHLCIHSIAGMCQHAEGTHIQLAGKRLPDGSFFSKLTAAKPDALAAARNAFCLTFRRILKS